MKSLLLEPKARYCLNFNILPQLHNRTHKTTLGGMGASVSQAHETLY